MPSISGMMQVPEATRVKSTKWAMVGYSAALVALSVVSVVLQGDPFSQHIGNLSPSGKGGGNILLSTGPHQQLAAVASEGSSASRKLLQCGECGCGVACPGGGGGATQVNMVRDAHHTTTLPFCQHFCSSELCPESKLGRPALQSGSLAVRCVASSATLSPRDRLHRFGRTRRGMQKSSHLTRGCGAMFDPGWLWRRAHGRRHVDGSKPGLSPFRPFHAHFDGGRGKGLQAQGPPVVCGAPHRKGRGRLRKPAAYRIRFAQGERTPWASRQDWCTRTRRAQWSQRQAW